MSKVSCPTPGSPLSHAEFTLKLYPSTLFTRALPEKVTQVLLIRSNESTDKLCTFKPWAWSVYWRSEEHTSELQSLTNLVCRLLLEKKKKKKKRHIHTKRNKLLNKTY